MNYVEPFSGSLAVLLGRPHAPTIETVNDIDGHLVNLWRSIKLHPEEVAKHADWPVMELDLHARHKVLVRIRKDFTTALESDPDYCYPKVAGWWLWGICAWIGSGWCQGKGDSTQVPDLGGTNGGNGTGKNYGKGIHAKSMRLPHLGAGTGGEDDHPCAHDGRGVHAAGMRRPQLSNHHGSGVHGKTNRTRLYGIIDNLAQRLRYVRVTCGPASRIMTPAVTWRHGTTGILLDPPYPPDAGLEKNIYSGCIGEERVAFDWAFRYCLENGHDTRLRIALCYYEGTTVRPGADLDLNGPVEDVTHALQSLGWEIVPWKARGGYGSQREGGNQNAVRERIAFSPGCLRAKQGSLF